MAKHQCVALLAVLCGAELALAAPPATDPVEGLRQALKTPGSASVLRDRNLAEAAGRLRGVPDLGRALVLKEWRDEDVDPQVADVDRHYRDALEGRFQQAVRAVFEHGAPPNQSAAADLVGQIAATGRNYELGRSLAPDLARLAVRGHPTVREAVARALGRIAPDPAVVLPVLQDMLTTGAVPLRLAAADAVFNLIHVTALRTAPGKGATRKDLVEAGCAFLPLAGVGMQDAEAAIRRTCLATLGCTVAALVPLIASSGAAPSDVLPLLYVIRNQGTALTRILDDPDPTLRLMARQTAEEIGRLRSQLPLSARQAAEADPLLVMLRVILPALARGLSDPDCRLRRATLGAMESLGPEAAPAAANLYDALEDTDRFVRWGAARLVGKIGPATVPGAVPALVRLLHDSDLDLRFAAAATLEQYGPLAAPAVPRLSELAAGPEALTVRIAALRTLARVGKASAGASVPVFTKALEDQQVPIRLAAIQALGAIGLPARPSTAALQKLRDDPSPEVRKAADEALLRIFAEEEKTAGPRH